MDNLNLMSNEVILLREMNVCHNSTTYTDDLYLTNMNIICVKKGVFIRTSKNIIKIPLNQIKRFEGNPQVNIGKQQNGVLGLEVYSMNTIDCFSFNGGNKKRIERWREAIIDVINGNSHNIYNNPVEEEQSFSDEIQDIKDDLNEVKQEILNAFGIKSKKKEQKTNVDKINKKCISCSAPLIGVAGQIIRCKYCDTDQKI